MRNGEYYRAISFMAFYTDNSSPVFLFNTK